jgi:hypothetical protein
LRRRGKCWVFANTASWKRETQPEARETMRSTRCLTMMFAKDRFGSQLGTSVARTVEQPTHTTNVKGRFSQHLENGEKQEDAAGNCTRKHHHWKDGVNTHASGLHMRRLDVLAQASRQRNGKNKGQKLWQSSQLDSIVSDECTEEELCAFCGANGQGRKYMYV